MKIGRIKSLKNSFSVLFIIQLSLAIVLGVLVLLLYLNQQNLDKSRDTYFNSYLLADELRQSSDDLTRMVRAYAATGDLKFKDYYLEILGIRNGEISRPLNYNRIYWDFIASTGQKPRSGGRAVSLRNLMVAEGFTAAEFEKLSLAEKNSNNLVKAEIAAMNAMKGIFADENGNFLIHKEPDVSLANTLVNNEAYYQAKFEIMKPIDDFFQMFQERTGQTVAKYLRIAKIMFLVISIIGMFFTLLVVVSYIILREQIIDKENAEKELLNFKTDLEKQVKERTSELQYSKEKLQNTLADAEKMNALMIGRELKMVELKKEVNNLKNKI